MTQTVPFPARPDPRTLARHQHLARQFTTLARRDARAATWRAEVPAPIPHPR